MSRLSQLPPSPEVHAALCSLLVEIGKTPMPTNTAELHQLMATLRKVYGASGHTKSCPNSGSQCTNPA
jgi:hypothetical protein